MKENITSEKIKFLRIQEITQHDNTESESQILGCINSNFQLTDEQRQTMNEILNDLIAEDEESAVCGLKDLRNQISVFGSKILNFLELRHITRIVEMMNISKCSDDSLTIVANIRCAPDISQFMILNKIHKPLKKFLESKNQRFVILSILIVGNNCECSTKFRNYAYEKGLLECVYNSNTNKLKDKIWAISNSLLRAPYPNNLEKDITTILINYSQQKYYLIDNETVRLRGLVFKTFVHMLDIGASDFIEIIIDNKYISVLIDEFLTGSAKRKFQTIRILSECCYNEEGILQMINNDFLPKFRDIMTDTNTSEDFLTYGLYLIHNWICQDNYLSYLCDIVLQKMDFSIFLKNHTFEFEQNAIKTLQYIVYVILPTEIPSLLSKECISLLINFTFTNSISTSSFIISIFYFIFERCHFMTDFLSQLSFILLPYIESNDFQEIFEAGEIEKATKLISYIKEYVNK